MKKLKLLSIFLFALFYMGLLSAGCEKENEYEDIPLESIQCPCEHKVDFIKRLAKKNILLFDATQTSWDEMKAQTLDNENSEFISYSKETKSMTFYSVRTTMMGVCIICNIPTKLDDWIIPSTGLLISFEADEFKSCTPQPDIANNTHSNCVLTILKIKLK